MTCWQGVGMLNRSLRRTVWAVFLALCFLLPGLAGAGATPAEMSVLINLAGKQRMLSQKMAKEMLLVISGVHAAENRYNLEGTAILFDRTLKGLLQGDAGLGLVRIDHPDIMAQLHVVSHAWTPFQKHVRDVLTGAISRSALARMADDNLLLLESMSKAVEMYVALAGQDEGDARQAKMYTVINMAGRERMLIQKMTKELLLIANGLEPEGNRVALRKTVDLFERSLDALLEGSAELGIPGTRDAGLRNQLGTVKGLWSRYRPILDAVVVNGAGSIQPGDLDKAAQINLRLLGEMNMAVKMVEYMAVRGEPSGR
ncbi:MAG: type IV pili methyl-accepting chemotaxis transducer N-terminal domain-containing protein [Magnetococcus sp. XQGC-1]